MYIERKKGVLRDLTFKYNQFLSEELNKKNINNNSERETIDNINVKK